VIVRCKVIPIEKKATDGSIFSKKVLLEYLQSDMYKYRIENKLMVGGITHLNRDESRTPSRIIAISDQMLLNKSITHYVTELYIQNDWMYGTIKFLDEKIMDEDSAKNIRFIKGLLLNGIYVPVSASVVAEWRGNVAVRVYDILGIDFTLEPGFQGAGVIDIKIQ